MASLDEQLTTYLSDAHAIEEQALPQMRAAPGMAGDERLEAVFKAGGFAFVLFAKSQPDTPGKLVSHALSYEHLELAGYELLHMAAERAGDAETAELARSIREDERAMSDRLEASFDLSVEASLRAVDPDD